jgi:hypothetical protein
MFCGRTVAGKMRKAGKCREVQGKGREKARFCPRLPFATKSKG